MDHVCSAFAVVLVLLSPNPGLLAQRLPGPAQSAEPRPPLETPLRHKAIDLIRQDVATNSKESQPSPPRLSQSSSEDVTTLSPVIVEGRKVPDISTPRERPVEEFFRTGTIAERIGPKVTTQLWMRGDRGVMLSFRW
jgi:hypothetical protein